MVAAPFGAHKTTRESWTTSFACAASSSRWWWPTRRHFARTSGLCTYGSPGAPPSFSAQEIARSSTTPQDLSVPLAATSVVGKSCEMCILWNVYLLTRKPKKERQLLRESDLHFFGLYPEQLKTPKIWNIRRVWLSEKSLSPFWKRTLHQSPRPVRFA